MPWHQTIKSRLRQNHRHFQHVCISKYAHLDVQLISMLMASYVAC